MDSLDQFYGITFSYWTWSQTGFVFQLSRRWTRYIFIYYLPSALCVITSWASFLINPEVNYSLLNFFCNPKINISMLCLSPLQVVPGRMSLLVTLFLSLTTLLVSTITSSPPVAVGITALTAWIIIQYIFIVAAIMAYAVLLAYFRFSDGTDEKKKEFGKGTDETFILIFPLIYFIITIIYWSVCLFHDRSVQ